MRFRELLKSASKGWPVLLIALAAEPANAQFREIQPQSSVETSTSEPFHIDLTPTRQQFVPPQIQPAPQARTRRPTLRRAHGMPTPAVPQSTATFVQRTPASQPTLARPTFGEAPPVGSLRLPSPISVAPVVVVELRPNQPTAATDPAVQAPIEVVTPAEPELAVSPNQPEIESSVEGAVGAQEAVETVASKPAETKNAETITEAETIADTEPSTEPTVEAEPDEATELENPFVLFQRDESDANRLFAPGPSAIVPIEPLAFNQIVPGRATAEELKEMWGQPAKQVSDGETTLLIFKAPGFRQVDVSTVAGEVEAILIHLDGAVDAAELSSELDLADIRPVKILDEEQQPLALGYPERGVLLTGADGTDFNKVTRILLEPVGGELFRLRAEADFRQNYTECLSDLEQAVRLNPEDAKAYWMQAELLSWAGRAVDAMDNAKIATRIRPDAELYQLTKARLNAANGLAEDAISVTRRIANDASVSSIVRARAFYQLGNLTANGAEADFEEALSFHMKAIDLAATHIAEADDEVRRMAKDVLVDSHLAVAQDIALGNFKRQDEVVPKWLMRATELAESFITDDQGEEVMRMEIYRSTLAIYTVMEGNFDASIATEEAIKEGRRLVGRSEDPLYQNYVERELAESLYHAAKIEQRCGRSEVAVRYADRATVLADAMAKRGQPTLFDRVMQGQLYFLTGSLHALQNQDHSTAVQNFEKALPAFDDERVATIVDGSAFGDLFVSMGVSYWQVGQREKAILLTQAGAELMQQGVQTGRVDLIELTVPYGNLSAMHRENGNDDQANHFASLMAKAKRDGKTTR